MKTKQSDKKVFVIITAIAVLIVGLAGFSKVNNSSYSPSVQDNQQISSQADLDQESLNLDSFDQDFNSMDSSMDQLNTDSSSL